MFRVLHALDQRGYTNHVLIITRFTVTVADMDELETLRHLRVTLLFTFSGITDPRIEPIAKSRITVTSIRTACARKQRTGVVLYWRPIVPGWNDQPATMAHVLQTGRHADAIVFTGYYHKPENDAHLREQGVTLPYGEQDYHDPGGLFTKRRARYSIRLAPMAMILSAAVPSPVPAAEWVCHVHAACRLAGAGSADRRGDRGHVRFPEDRAAAGGGGP